MVRTGERADLEVVVKIKVAAMASLGHEVVVEGLAVVQVGLDWVGLAMWELVVVELLASLAGVTVVAAMVEEVMEAAMVGEA